MSETGGKLSTYHPHQVSQPPNLNEYQLQTMPLTTPHPALSNSQQSPPGTTPPPAPQQGQGNPGAQQLSPDSAMSVTSKNVQNFAPDGG